MSLLTELDAFFTDHHHCGDLDAGVDGPIVWIACDGGGQHGQASERGGRCPPILELDARGPPSAPAAARRFVAEQLRRKQMRRLFSNPRRMP